MNGHVERACEEIDAAVFSGALLEDPAATALLEEYMNRWARAIAARRQTNAPDEGMIGWAEP